MKKTQKTPLREFQKAKNEYSDLLERGFDNEKNNSAIGSNWNDVRKELFTPEEIAESDLRVSIISEIINARNEKGISQKQLELMSGVKQPVIARLEKGQTNPQLDTILKLLVPLGKKLIIVDDK